MPCKPSPELPHLTFVRLLCTLLLRLLLLQVGLTLFLIGILLFLLSSYLLVNLLLGNHKPLLLFRDLAINLGHLD